METALPNRLALGALVLALLAPGIAHAWWNDEWTVRKPMRVDTSATGANISDPIGPAPVLVRLHPGNFKFELAKEDGSDLRFVASDDKTPLPFHLEKYDALLGEALVWVGFPDLKPGVKTDFWIYFKNPKAQPAEDAKGTFDKATALVWHFAEKGPPRDSSVWANHGQAPAPGTDGALIGRGLQLDGSSVLAVPPGASLSWGAGAKLTWSAWIKPAAPDSTATVFGRDAGLVVGLEQGKPFVRTGKQQATASAVLPAGGWHHLAVTAGDSLQLYVDGSPAAKVAAALPGLAGPAAIGEKLKAELDEMEISSVERPPGFFRLAVATQGPDPGKVLIGGPEEEAASWASGYFAIILRSVTLDGWVVIGLLAIMMLISWMVMASKASYLGAVSRANDRFAETFHAAGSDLVTLVTSERALGEDEALRRSPMLSIWHIAANEVRKRSDGSSPLSAESIESIRASLDAALVRENQRLNERMVLLTIAISGGPFLGLLGTVVGVMITFASIAAAGDVNVNAIAPGIAAALVATVAGLAVAIPALFGYNWLLSRVKDAAANQQVFADELLTRIAESYSASSVSAAPTGRARASGARP